MPTKLIDGMEFHGSDFFYVGDPELVTTWKLRKGGRPGVVDRVHVSAAAAALGPNPPHGQGVDIPRDAIAGVKRKILAAMKRLKYTDEEMRGNFAWLFGEGGESLKFEEGSLKCGRERMGSLKFEEGSLKEGDGVEIEIFRAGDYGEKGKWNEGDIKILEKDYDPGLHEAPVTVDHKQTGPAYGWIKGLRNAGGRLIARIGNIAEGLRDAIRDHRYKKVSAEIYGKFRETGRPYLRALTFLGAQVPEIKGLRAIELGEDAEWIEFDEDDLIEGGDQDMAQVIELERKNVELEQELKNAQAEKDAAEAEKKKAEAEKDAAIQKFAESQKASRRKEIAKDTDNWIAEKLRDGFITPAMVDAGLPELIRFAEEMGTDNVITFGENEKRRPADILKEVFSQTQILKFEEIAKAEKTEPGDVVNFSEKAKACGVGVREYREAVEICKQYPNDADMTPENWIMAHKDVRGR